MSENELRRKSARQRKVRPTAHSSALESLRAAREGRESRAEQFEVRRYTLLKDCPLPVCMEAGAQSWLVFVNSLSGTYSPRFDFESGSPAQTLVAEQLACDRGVCCLRSLLPTLCAWRDFFRGSLAKCMRNSRVASGMPLERFSEE